jgi:hypothetical protein
MPNLHQSTWDRDILYAVRYSKVEQYSVRLLFVKSQKYEPGEQSKITINVLLYGDNLWTIALHKWSSVQWKIMDISTSFIWIVIIFDEAFKYGVGAKFGSYVGTNADPVCVEFCNLVQVVSYSLLNLLNNARKVGGLVLLKITRLFLSLF